MISASATTGSALATGLGLESAAANVDLVIFLVVGLLAGAHCLGMCGPLVATYGDRIAAADERRRADDVSWYRVRQHGLFNLGRTAGYAVLGGVFGLLGAAAFAGADAVVPVAETVRGGVGVLVGLAIVAIGLRYVRGPSAAVGARVPLIGSVFGRVSAAIGGRVDRLATSGGIVGLGALHGLLPCPIVYPAYLYAFAVGDPVRGALSLGAIGLGTVPTLFLYGTLLSSLETSTRVRLHRALGVAFVAMGYVALAHGLMAFGVHLPHPPLPFYQPL